MRTILVLAALLASSVLAADTAPPPARLKSATAKHDAAVRVAETAYLKAQVAAKTAYLAEIRVALAAATREGKLDEANAIDAVRKAVEADIKAAQEKLADDTGPWTTLLRGDNPEGWSDAVAKAPENTRFLRMTAAGKSVVVPITKAQLASIAVLVPNKYVWNGTATSNWNARQLGILRLGVSADAVGDVQALDAQSNWRRGWGFGVRRGMNDRQGFMWAGKEIEPTAFTIEVRGGQLTAAERAMLLE